MYVRHFFKMLLGLVCMAVIGVAGLAVANYYSKAPAAASGTTSAITVQ
jgi:hypothetical protein